MTYTIEGIVINSILILGAMLCGVFFGRLWEIIFHEKGSTLGNAIMTARAIRRKL